MLEKLKLALRLKSDAFNEQIEDCINYVKQDLLDIGIICYDEDNQRIVHVTELYCKFVFNYENKGEWYQTQYINLRNQISMQSNYIGDTDE